jgi:hypothetical protein
MTETRTHWAALLDAITTTPTSTPDPLHTPDDHDKVNQLATDMAVNGWRGAPLIVDGDSAITGSHRIAAVARLINRDGTEVLIPRVEITDLLDLWGVDWAEYVQDHDGDWYRAVVATGGLLPTELVAYLGLDAH